MNTNELNYDVALEIVRASDIEPKEVKWLWYPYIPFGKVTLLQGDPGDGKSKFMLSLAALLSKGEALPFSDEEEREPITIIYQTTEDDADDTVVPRFNSAGGNGDNLIFIKEDMKSLSFGDNRIREAIEKYNAKLLILDPMSSYIGESCSMNNANETRAEFNHLIAVAKETGCAIVIIAHMNKMKDSNPLYRTNGSIDIAGAARSILAIIRTANKEAPAERYLVQVKEYEQRIVCYEVDTALAEQNKPQGEEKFCTMTLRGIKYTEKAAAGEMLLAICKEYPLSTPTEIGSYRGFKMEVFYDTVNAHYCLNLCGKAKYKVDLGFDPLGNLTRIENELAKLPARLEAAKTKRTEIIAQFETAKVEVQKPFAFEDELKEKSERLNALNIELNLDKKDPAVLDAEPEQSEEQPERKCENRER